jgi:hypothetical protein
MKIKKELTSFYQKLDFAQEERQINSLSKEEFW